MKPLNAKPKPTRVAAEHTTIHTISNDLVALLDTLVKLAPAPYWVCAVPEPKFELETELARALDTGPKDRIVKRQRNFA